MKRDIGRRDSGEAGGRLRSRRFDDLGLRRALGDRMLPAMVAAMTFLAALALAGVVGAAGLAQHWQRGAAAVVTVQVPQPGAPAADAPGQTRRERVVALAKATPGVASVRALSDTQLADLLQPWLGNSALRLSLPLPAVVDLRMAESAGDTALEGLGQQLEKAAPGTLTESHGVWVRRLSVLARSLQACAWAALLLVVAVAAAVVAVATRTGLVARRQAIEIVHGLGATDSYIAARFAGRATRLAALGGAVGAVAALPVLVLLAALAAPFAGPPPPPPMAGPAGEVLGWLLALPVALWLALPGLPLAAALIGLATAQGTVRAWLRWLP
jgi:cell division transport system permease protein